MNTKQTRRWNVDDKSTPDWRVVQCLAFLIIQFICSRSAQCFTSQETKWAIKSFCTTLSWIQIYPLLGDCSRVIWRWHLIIEIKSRVFGLLNMEMVLCERCLVRDKFLHAIGNQRAVGHVLQCSVTSLSFHYIEFNGFLKCSHCSETKPTPKTENVWMERAKTNTEMKRSFSLPQLPFVTISVWYNCVLVNDTTNEVRPRMARHNGTIQGLPWSMIIFVWQWPFTLMTFKTLIRKCVCWWWNGIWTVVTLFSCTCCTSMFSWKNQSKAHCYFSQLLELFLLFLGNTRLYPKKL